MRLLIVSSEFPPGPGGIGTHAHQMAAQLEKIGWEVKVLARQDYASVDEVTTFNARQPFEIIHLEPMSSAVGEFLYRGKQLLDAINQFKPNVLLVSGERMAWLVALLTLLRPQPWVMVGHGTEFKVGSGLSAQFSRWAFSRANSIICVSEFTRGVMQRAGVAPRHSPVIPNGADDTAFDMLPVDEVRRFRESLGFADACLLLTVGHVTSRKGQDIVIRAMPAVLEKFPNAHYLIVGLPTKREEFEALAQQLGVADHVHFLGRQSNDDVIRFMNTADLFVITSRYTRDGDFEGYGIVVIEAAMCGTPSVVARGSGLTEAIEDGVTGIAVDAEDPTDTARGIIRLLSDDTLRREMGIQAHQRAHAEQTWSRRAEQYDAVLRDLAKA